MYNKYQAGLGMVEVLVSLILLAFAVLGFSGLQIQALRLTQDNSQLTTAAEIAADFKGRYINMASLYSGVISSSASMNKLSNTYLTEFSATNPTSKKCTNSGEVCTLDEVVKSDVAELKLRATQAGMNLGLVQCASATGNASISAPVCLLVAWGETRAEIGDAPQSCISNEDVYKPLATCYRAEGVL